MKNKNQKIKKSSLFLVILLVVAVLAGLTYYFFVREDSKLNIETAQKTCTTYGNRVPEQCIADYIGLTPEQAKTKAQQHGYIAKISKIDGVGQINTDEGSTPIYLEIQDETVVRGNFEGGRASGPQLD